MTCTLFRCEISNSQRQQSQLSSMWCRYIHSKFECCDFDRITASEKAISYMIRVLDVNMALIGENARDANASVLVIFFPSLRIDKWLVLFSPTFLSTFQNALFIQICFFFTISPFCFVHNVLVCALGFVKSLCGKCQCTGHSAMDTSKISIYANVGCERHKWKINMKCACVACIAPAVLSIDVNSDGGYGMVVAVCVDCL